MHRSLAHVGALLLLLLSLPRPAAAQGTARWLADPELLTRRKVVGADGGLLTQVADFVSDLDLADSEHGWATSYSGLLRFDGRFWRPAMNVGPRISLGALDLASRSTGWAVGSAFAGGPTTIYTLRYDGTAWTPHADVVQRDGSTGPLFGTLVDVVALPDGSAWAVGVALDPQGAPGAQRPLLLHFNGSAWRDRTPSDWRHGQLMSISVLGPAELRVGGSLGQRDGTGADAARPVILHFNNGTWNEEPLSAEGDRRSAFVFDLEMRDASEGWAVVSELLGRCSVTRLLHFANGRWSDVTPADQPLQSITQLALVPGTNRGWASLAGCGDSSSGPPELRMRFENGTLSRDQGGTSLVPDRYALLSDTVQWASAGGSLLRFSAERLPTERVAQPASGARFFSTTGHTLAGAFRQYYESHGLELGDPGISDRESLALFGYPLSEPFREINPDTGEILEVQYFERARFEHHPNNPDPYRVLLGRLSANTVIRLGYTDLPVPQITGDCQSFTETPYALCPPFRAFWNASGGLPVFGLPLTPVRNEQSATDGRTYQTQWFERERLEHHPENRGTPYEILLGLLAAEELRTRGYLPGS